MKSKHKKKDEIYCILPHHVKLERCKSKYEAVLAWSPNLDDVRDAMDTLDMGDECDIFIGSLKAFRKEALEQCEMSELVYYNNQWIQRIYTDTLKRMVCEQRSAFNTTIGLISCILEDKEEVDRSDRKILKKAMEIITEIRDAKPDPITLETIRLGRELDQEYYERIKDKDTEDDDMFE